MVFTLLVFAVALFAIIRASVLTSRLKTLRNERDELLAIVASQQRQIEQLKSADLEKERDHQTERSAVAEPVAAPEIPPLTSPAEVSVQEQNQAQPIETPVPLTPPESALEPSAPPPDWESLIGVKGATWMGGIAFLLSAIFFARWTVEQGLITPVMAFAVMFTAGVGGILSAEGASRRGLARVASPASGAGIAFLFVAFLAAHGRYSLIPLPVAALAMVGVTATGGLLAVRYQAFATAFLTLLAGFATAWAISTSEEAALGGFAYALLLDLGALLVALRTRWFGLLGLSLAGTLILQIRWFWNFMSPENMKLGIAIVLGFGILYLLQPLAVTGQDTLRMRRVSAWGGQVPFLFALALATAPSYIDQWPWLFGMVGILDATILMVAVLRTRGGLLRSAAIGTTVTLAWWALQGLKVDSGASLSASTLFAICIVSMFALARRIAHRLGRADGAELRVLESAALAAGAGLVLFGTIMVGYGRGAPVGPFLAIATTLVLILIEVSGHEGRLAGALAFGTVGLAGLTQIWFLSAVNAHTLIFYLAGPVVVSLFLSILATRRAGSSVDVEAEIAVQASGWISILGLFLALVASDRTSTGWPLFLPLASTGWPLFLGFAIQLGVVTASVLRSNWTLELPPLLGASTLYVWLWQRSYLTEDQFGVALGFSSLLYLGFLLFPMIVPAAKLKEAPAAWITAAFSGPFLFFPLRVLYRSAFGESTIGLLPLAMAAISVWSLVIVSGRFVAIPGDARSALLRLRHLTLFTLVACWFVATAVRIQLDNQWVTLGWALEAAGLCWLFRLLPHPALPAFALILQVLVSVRLLFNLAVLGYEERALPLFNWILYTYGGAALCAFASQSFLRRASSDRWTRYLADAVALSGLLTGFWFINLEILDYFFKGTHITLSGHEGYSVKLAFSVGWGFYAVLLLAAGVVMNRRPLRYLSLTFMILTVVKVFIYDLAALGGFFQVFSFFGLAAGLIAVSFFYQRFVLRTPRR